MSLISGEEPNCSICRTDESDVWERAESGEILCDKCYRTQRSVDKLPSLLKQPLAEGTGSRQESITVYNGPSLAGTKAVRYLVETNDRRPCGTNNHGVKSSKDGTCLESKTTGSSTRKSARIKPLKNKSITTVKAQATKGRSRRVTFKKNPVKAPSLAATVVTSNHIFHKGLYYQVGDIVSVIDDDDCGIYYAQIRGFLQDPYNEKSAVITWLIPTIFSPNTDFDAATYILGPEEDIPRKMDCFEFVCHAPSDYFHHQNAPYATQSPLYKPGFIWTGLQAGAQQLLTTLGHDCDEDRRAGDSKTGSGRRIRDSVRKQGNIRDKKPK